jgi:NadR type nicotinamide-nucleotide adenylyltransferase
VNPNAATPVASRPRPALFHVAITGSECTGKTTLARQLAEHYSVEFVPEFVRRFADTVGGRLQFTDHGPIARGQMALEDEYEARASGLLIHDTDLLSTVVYCRHYFGRCPDWIVAAATERRADLYLVCDVDVPWVPDALRDRGDRREEMHSLFVSAVEESGARWELLRGNEKTRFEKARELIAALFPPD